MSDAKIKILSSKARDLTASELAREAVDGSLPSVPDKISLSDAASKEATKTSHFADIHRQLEMQTALKRLNASLPMRSLETIKKASQQFTIDKSLIEAAKASHFADIHRQLEMQTALKKLNASLPMPSLEASRRTNPTFTEKKLLVKTPQQSLLKNATSSENLLLTDTDQAAGQTIRSASEIGSLIRSIRKSRNLSQQEFADAAGVGRRFLSELENGKKTVEFDAVLKVIAAAGIDLLAFPR